MSELVPDFRRQRALVVVENNAKVKRATPAPSLGWILIRSSPGAELANQRLCRHYARTFCYAIVSILNPVYILSNMKPVLILM